MLPSVHPLQTTFRVLANPRNVAAIPVLALGMQSSDPFIRVKSIQTLLARGRLEDANAIVEGIDHCHPDDLPFLRSHPGLFISPIETCLACREPHIRQQGLVAIAKIRVASHFHRLIEVVESFDDPQQMVASQLLMNLANELGQESRKSATPRAVNGRLELIDALEVSLANFSRHKVRDIIDAWLQASHWGDESFQRLFSDMPPEESSIIMKRIMTSHSPEIDELLLGCYWSQAPIVDAISMAIERASGEVPRELIRLEKRFGIQAPFFKNLAKTPIEPLRTVDITKLTSDSDDYESLFRLMAVGGATPDTILWNVIRVLDRTSDLSPQLAKNMVAAIRSIRFANAILITMVMSDCFDLPDIDHYQPPPWKASLRSALDNLLSRYYALPPAISNGLDVMLQEFRCDNLFEFLETWPEAHVRAYARIAKLVDKRCVETIDREANCGSPTRRARAIRLIRYLGRDEQFNEIAIQALRDTSDDVRIQAIQAIAFGMEKTEAIELISPMLQDEIYNVQATASQSLMDLRDAIHEVKADG